MKIYADNAATTRVSDTALAAMTPCFQEIYGNPSSLHTPGQRAAEKLAAESWHPARRKKSPQIQTASPGDICSPLPAGRDLPPGTERHCRALTSGEVSGKLWLVKTNFAVKV